jgi:hypothetical protein
MWIRIRNTGFNADPDPAFFRNADSFPESQTNPNPDPGHTLPSHKVEFIHEKYTSLRYSLLKGWKLGLFVHFGHFFLLLEPDPNSQPGEPNQCGIVRIRIIVYGNTVSAKNYQ